MNARLFLLGFVLLMSPVRAAAYLAYFWSDNPYVFWNRNLIALAQARQLRLLETARLFAMVHTAVADAVIVGFESKYRYTTWRPRTAIPRADTDGNADTDADPRGVPCWWSTTPNIPRVMASGRRR